MANRPLGVDPAPSREFAVRLASEGKPNLREKISEEWYYFKSFSFGRGNVIELDVEDDMIESLIYMGWIRKRRNEFYFTRKGNKELLDFAEKEIERIKSE